MNDFFLLEVCHLKVSYQLPLPSLRDFPVHWNQVKKLHELVPFISIHIFFRSSSKWPCCTSENYLPSCTWVTLQDKSSLCECIPKFITDPFFGYFSNSLKLLRSAVLLCKGIKFHCRCPELRFSLPCLVSWDYPLCLSASFTPRTLVLQGPPTCPLNLL